MSYTFVADTYHYIPPGVQSDILNIKTWNNQRVDSTASSATAGQSDETYLLIPGPALLTDIVWTVCPVVTGTEWAPGGPGTSPGPKFTGIIVGQTQASPNADALYQWVDDTGVTRTAGTVGFFGASYGPVDTHAYLGDNAGVVWDKSPPNDPDDPTTWDLTTGMGAETQHLRGLGHLKDINIYAPADGHVQIKLQIGADVQAGQTLAASIGWRPLSNNIGVDKREQQTTQYEAS